MSQQPTFFQSKEYRRGACSRASPVRFQAARCVAVAGVWTRATRAPNSSPRSRVGCPVFVSTNPARISRPASSEKNLEALTMVRKTTTLLICLYMLLIGCTPGVGSLADSSSQDDQHSVVAKRLEIRLPRHVGGTIKCLAVYHPPESQFSELSESVQKAIPMAFEQMAFDLRTLIPKMELVERSHLDSAMREIHMQASGLVKDEDMVRLGRMLGAGHLLLYELAYSSNKDLEDIRAYGGTLHAMVLGKIIQIETGLVLYSERTRQYLQFKRPPLGGYWNNLAAGRNWALNCAMAALAYSLEFAFNPASAAKVADGIILDTGYEGPVVVY